jgi:hypothetical protein
MVLIRSIAVQHVEHISNMVSTHHRYIQSELSPSVVHLSIAHPSSPPSQVGIVDVCSRQTPSHLYVPRSARSSACPSTSQIKSGWLIRQVQLSPAPSLPLPMYDMPMCSSPVAELSPELAWRHPGVAREAVWVLPDETAREPVAHERRRAGRGGSGRLRHSRCEAANLSRLRLAPQSVHCINQLCRSLSTPQSLLFSSLSTSFNRSHTPEPFCSHTGRRRPP